jgi:hypothetical protein
MNALSAKFLKHHLADGLNAPLHILFFASLARAFGGVRRRIDFDMFERRPYAFGVLRAADLARQCGIPQIYAIECGVASGVGLRSLVRIAKAVHKVTGVEIRVVGFDSGVGMPEAIDYRDHPELYMKGDFPPSDNAALEADIAPVGRLILGPAEKTIQQFLNTADVPIGFISIDVDYYSSGKNCLSLLDGRPDQYLPWLPVFFDDVLLDPHNPWCGELLAINEFNAEHQYRKISPFQALRQKRFMKNAGWLEQMYCAHILDHSYRNPDSHRERSVQTM